MRRQGYQNFIKSSRELTFISISTFSIFSFNLLLGFFSITKLPRIVQKKRKKKSTVLKKLIKRILDIRFLDLKRKMKNKRIMYIFYYFKNFHLPRWPVISQMLERVRITIKKSMLGFKRAFLAKCFMTLNFNASCGTLWRQL